MHVVVVRLQVGERHQLFDLSPARGVEVLDQQGGLGLLVLTARAWVMLDHDGLDFLEADVTPNGVAVARRIWRDVVLGRARGVAAELLAAKVQVLDVREIPWIME